MSRKRRLAGMPFRSTAGLLDVLFIVGAATEAEVKSAEVTGLERAIPKNKGAEFASLLHQLGAELVMGPYSPNVHKILLEVSADAKDRLPKRGQKKPVEAPPPKPAKAAPTLAKKAPPAAEKKKEEVKKKPVKAAASSPKIKSGAKKKHEPVKLAKRKPR